MIRTLTEEIGELPYKSSKERVFKLAWIYSHPFTREMIEEFFDKRIVQILSINPTKITDEGISPPKIIYINGAPYPRPEDIEQFICYCKGEGVLDKFDWNVDIKIDNELL